VPWAGVSRLAGRLHWLVPGGLAGLFLLESGTRPYRHGANGFPDMRQAVAKRRRFRRDERAVAITSWLLVVALQQRHPASRSRFFDLELCPYGSDPAENLDAKFARLAAVPAALVHESLHKFLEAVLAQA
jgi:hypothetical protein